MSTAAKAGTLSSSRDPTRSRSPCVLEEAGLYRSAMVPRSAPVRTSGRRARRASHGRGRRRRTSCTPGSRVAPEPGELRHVDGPKQGGGENRLEQKTKAPARSRSVETAASRSRVESLPAPHAPLRDVGAHVSLPVRAGYDLEDLMKRSFRSSCWRRSRAGPRGDERGLRHGDLDRHYLLHVPRA